MNSQPLLRATRLIPLFLTTALFADTLVFVPAESDQNRIQVEGPSNIRDWDAVSTEIQGGLEFKNTPFWQAETDLPGTAPELVKGHVKIKTETLTNDSRGLTTNLHKYMGAKEHPHVEFDVTEVKPVEIEGEQEGLRMEMAGKLTVKGVTKEISFPVEWFREGDQLRITGRAEMKMTDFDIEPPRKMMGTIRAADEVTITFTWVLTRKEP
ncbi:MAG: YceI family protein [Kiritimatiellae bacterium]|jgi:polyisoprenoid-binding protein YceI|nr:YceI family protein [Kiritimatiellia bacterium]